MLDGRNNFSFSPIPSSTRASTAIPIRCCNTLDTGSTIIIYFGMDTAITTRLYQSSFPSPDKLCSLNFLIPFFPLYFSLPPHFLPYLYYWMLLLLSLGFCALISWTVCLLIFHLFASTTSCLAMVYS